MAKFPKYDPEDDAVTPKGVGSFMNAPNLQLVKSDRKPQGALPAPEPTDVDFEEIETDDGGVIVRFGGPELLQNDAERYEDDDETFYANLAETMDESDMALIAMDLLEGIEVDIQSRSVWMADYTRGQALMGTKVKTPRGEATGEGVSQVDHPALVESCIVGASTAQAELLPTAGPVKIDNSGAENAITDQQASRLEKDFNRFIVDKSPEYVPDTERLIFQAYFGGMGFKKLFHCPLRRRPVSDAVAPGDFIISNDATSLTNTSRKTHRIPMRQSTMKRMQFVGAYRDVDLQTPHGDTTLIEQKTATDAGVQATTTRQEDNEFTVYECHCEIDMPGDEHIDKGKKTGLPRPYIVTIDKDSRQVLEIRRNWVREDDLFTERRRFVAYQFMPMFGFWAAGLLHILANSTSALTAAWRIMLDNGMFANFPGFLYKKNGSRQANNTFRVAPGEGAPVDVAGADKIQDAIMALPYKEFGPAFAAFVQQLGTDAQRVGGTANIPVAEGKAEAPVGSMLAALEQVAKMVSAVHRRFHTAQKEEFQIWLELIREKPEDFVRQFEREGYWTTARLREAIENYALTPRSDPNTPTHVHRILKAMALIQLADRAPERYDGVAVDTHALEVLGFENPQRFFAAPSAAPAMPQDPSLAIAEKVAETKILDTQVRKQIEDRKAEIKMLELQLKKQIADDANVVKMAIAEQDNEAAAEDRTQHGAIEVAKLDEQRQQAETQATMEGEAHKLEARRTDITERHGDEGNKIKLKQASRPAPKPAARPGGKK